MAVSHTQSEQLGTQVKHNIYEHIHIYISVFPTLYENRTFLRKLSQVKKVYSEKAISINYIGKKNWTVPRPSK